MYSIEIDNKKFPVDYYPVSPKEGSALLNAGIIKLKAGRHVVRLKAGKYMGDQLMRPLYITLVPVG